LFYRRETHKEPETVEEYRTDEFCRLMERKTVNGNGKENGGGYYYNHRGWGRYF